MAGLVGYESSDESEDVEREDDAKPLQETQDETPQEPDQGQPLSEKVPASEPPEADRAAPENGQPSMIGPLPQPQSGDPSFPPLEEAPLLQPPPPPPPPGSPYTSTRTLIHDLTLPAVPNMDIPPSPPPGSPSTNDATTAKFEHFLHLKSKGVHFNSRLTQSPALRNPSLTDKLLGFVGLSSAADQYATVLPPDLWDPAGFPREAYKEQLRQSQSDIAQARARGKGAAVEFVPASSAGGGGGGSGAPGEASTAAGRARNGIADGSSASTAKRKTRFDT